MANGRWLLVGIYLAATYFTSPSEAVGAQVLQKTLFTHLFTDYDPNLIPICVLNETVTLNMDMALRQILELNEREQMLETNVWLRLRWNDCRLVWDPTTYNNLTYILVYYANVWTPDITLYDSGANEVMFPGKEDNRATISSTGSVMYNFPTVMKSICRVNVKYFPFDTQRCGLQFGSWSHHGWDLDIVARNPTGDISNYVENSEWTIDEFPAERHQLFYGCCPEPYPDVTYYAVIKRRPDFYLLTMIFPCILTSCVAAFAFLLPVESGEKVSLEITVLLSLAVFLLLVSESLPPSSDNFPIIGSYFAASMVLVSLSLLQTVIVVNVFYRGTSGRKVPKWVKLVFLRYLGRLLFVTDNSNKVSDEEHELESTKSIQLKSYKKKKYTDDTKLSTDIPKPSTDITEDGTVPTLANGTDTAIGIRTDTDRFRGTQFGILPSFSLKDPTTALLKEQTSYLRSIESMMKENKVSDDLNAEWRDISNVLDRLCLILYFFVTIITTLSFLLQSA